MKRIGVLGGVSAQATVDATVQADLDAAIRAVMEGRDGPAETRSAHAAIRALRAAPVDGILLGCTEISLLLGPDAEEDDLVNPVAVLAEAAVRLAINSV